MTETKKKALALLNEICVEMGLDKVRSLELDMPGERALLRAIEQHEAFRQEVSDAMEGLKKVWGRGWRQCSEATMCDRFIIAKPDPLVEVWDHMIVTGNFGPLAFRAAIEARGGRIVWGEG